MIMRSEGVDFYLEDSLDVVDALRRVKWTLLSVRCQGRTFDLPNRPNVNNLQHVNVRRDCARARIRARASTF